MNTYFIETGVMATIGMLIAVLGYFLAQQNKKIESMDTKLGELRDNIAGEMKMTKSEVVALFHDICHERQTSCNRVMHTKLDVLVKSQDAVFAKLEAIQHERRGAWDRQENLNDKFKAHIHRCEATRKDVDQ